MKIKDIVASINDRNHHDEFSGLRLLRKRRNRGQNVKWDKVNQIEKDFMANAEVDDMDVITSSHYYETFSSEDWEWIMKFYDGAVEFYGFPKDVQERISDWAWGGDMGEEAPGRDEAIDDWLFEWLDAEIYNAKRTLFKQLANGYETRHYKK